MRRRIEMLDGRIITDTGPGTGRGGDHDRTSGPAAPAPARLRPRDLAGLASVGLRTRKLRAALSALGIAIGVAAIVAVLGLARSSQAGLLAEISRLGTNLLTVTNGQDLTGQTAELPARLPRGWSPGSPASPPSSTPAPSAPTPTAAR